MKERIMDVPRDGSPRSDHVAYGRWNMLMRRATAQPDIYGDVTICDEWYTYSVFKAWLTSHDGWEHLSIDKDLLVPGNRHYSPDTCCLITRALNTFLVDSRSDSGHLTGARYKPHRKKPWEARITHRDDGKKISRRLGRYHTEQEAHAAWKKAKHERACLLAEGIQDQRIANALRTRYL